MVSRAFYKGKQSSKYWRYGKGSNCQTESSLCTNYDSFIPLSFIHFGIPYNLKPTLQQTEEISSVIEILLSLMYSRIIMVLIMVLIMVNMAAVGEICNSSDPSEKIDGKKQNKLKSKDGKGLFIAKDTEIDHFDAQLSEETVKIRFISDNAVPITSSESRMEPKKQVISKHGLNEQTNDRNK